MTHEKIRATKTGQNPEKYMYGWKMFSGVTLK